MESNLHGTTILSKSNNPIPHDNLLNISHSHNKSSFSIPAPNSANKLNGKPLSLNSNTPLSTFSIPKLKTELMTLNVTPKLSLPPNHYLHDGNDEINKLKTPLESGRIIQSGSQPSLRKPFDSGTLLQIPNSPFKNSVMNSSASKAIGDYKSPIRVLDMGNSQLILSTRSRENLKEIYKAQKIVSEEFNDYQLPPTKKEREQRFRSEPASVRTATLKSAVNTDQNLERLNREETEEGMREFSHSANKVRFPKEIFCMNLRKKAYA